MASSPQPDLQRAQHLQRQQQDALRHLRDAVATTSATEQLGAETLTELARQGEALARTQARVDEADAHAEHGKHVLRGMSSLVGAALNRLRGAPPVAMAHAARLAVQRQARAAAARAGGASAVAWHPNAPACELCGHRFPLLAVAAAAAARRHHCRACGACVCGACSAGTGDARACVQCCAEAEAEEGGATAAIAAAALTAPAVAASGPGRPANGGGGGGGGGSSGSGVSDAMRAQLAAEEALLATISANVSRIGNISREMGSELGRQDRALDELTTSISKVTTKVSGNAKVANKLAKS